MITSHVLSSRRRGASDMLSTHSSFLLVAFLVISLPPEAAGADLGRATLGIASDDEVQKEDSWSKPVNGLQARLKLVQKPNLHGVRWLVPNLELRNVRDLANPMEVDCSGSHLKIELVDEKGKVVRDGLSGARSGPHVDPSVVSLPFDSQLRFSLECRNWGIPPDAAAMVATDSARVGDWCEREGQSLPARS